MTFQEAAAAASPALRAAIREGKQGLKAEHRAQVDCAESQRFTGSIDLDAALRESHPQASRWDYGMGFRESNGRESALWIEVHPASPGDVDTVLKKHAWLLQWLKQEAHDLAAMSRRASGRKSFFWLATGAGVGIRAGTPQARRLQAAGFDLPRRKIFLM